MTAVNACSRLGVDQRAQSARRAAGNTHPRRIRRDVDLAGSLLSLGRFRRGVIGLALRRIGQRFSLSDPASAHRLVGVDECLDDVVLRLRVGQLGVEEAALGVEHLQIARVAALEAQVRRASRA